MQAPNFECNSTCITLATLKLLMARLFPTTTRDKPILLYSHLFSFFLGDYAQYFAQSCNYFVWSLAVYIASYLTMTSHTYISKLSTNIIDSYS